MGITQREPRHEMFVQWLTGLLRDDHGRAVIRELVKQHELPVIDRDRGSISAADAHSRP